MSTPIYLLVIYLVAGSPTPIITNTATPDMQTCKALGERVMALKVHDVNNNKSVHATGNYRCIDPSAVATITPAPPDKQPLQQ